MHNVIVYSHSNALSINFTYLLNPSFSSHYKVFVFSIDEEHTSCEVLVVTSDKFYHYFQRLQSVHTKNYLKMTEIKL